MLSARRPRARLAAAALIGGLALVLLLALRPAFAAAAPPVTDGLELWYDADSQGLADGAPVTRWTDGSGHGRDLTAFDAGAAATYRTNAVNGHAAVEFDGSNSLLKTYGSTFTISQPDTYFIVYRQLDTREAYIWDSRDSNIRQLLGQGPFSDMEMYADVDLIDTLLTWPMPSYELWSGTFQGDGSTLYRNGALVATGRTGNQALGTGFTLGGLSTSGQYGYLRSHSLVAEVLFYSRALTDAERDQVTSWLNAKYGVISSAPPSATADPTVTGSPTEGATLTAHPGTWTGQQPISYAYRWQRCDSAGQGCADIAGATDTTYATTSADVGSRLRVHVDATNAVGAGAADSDVTAVVTQAPPANTALPTVSGNAVEGGTLTATHGSWSGSQPIGYGYAWLRCDSAGNGCAAISGATDATYTATTADVNSTLRVRVTASNGQGNDTATSAATGVVRSASSGTPPPVTSGLEMWYDADSQSYADGAAVTRWTDDSGHGRDLTAFDAGAAAKYRANAVNGHAAIEFDGSNSLLKTYGSSFTIAQPDTFFIVYRSLDPDTSNRAFVMDSRNSSLRQVFGRPSQGAERLYADIDLDFPGFAYPFSGYQVAAGVFDGASSELYRNGTLVGTGNAGRSSLDGLTVGGLSTSAQYGYDRTHSLVAEILWYGRRLSAGERDQVSDWLRDKYIGAPGPTPPSNDTAPSVSGVAREGSALTAGQGSWSGTAPIGYAYAWQRCDSSGGGCAAIPGATDSSYTATAADVGSTLRVRVTASNAQGQASASSVPTGVVRAANADAPPVTQNLELWYDADSQSYADGAAVTRWTDDSGHGRDLTAFDAGAAAKYRANAVNGHAAIEFDGSNSLLKTYGSSFTIAQPDTFFIVYRQLDTREAYIWDSRDSNVRQLLGQGPFSDMEMYANVDLIDNQLAWPMPSFELWDGTFLGQNSTLYRNGTLVATGPTGSSALSGFTVGGLSTTGQWGYNRAHAYVAEILVYSSALSASERAAVQSWLNAKYHVY